MTENTRGIWLTLASGVLASIFLTSYKLGASYGNVTDMVFMLLAAAALLNTTSSTLEARGFSWLRFDAVGLWVGVALAAFTLFGNLCSAEAVARISAPLTSVFQQTQVLFVALLGLVFLGEQLSLRFWLGAALATLGLLFMRLPGSAEASLDFAGVAFATGSALAFGIMVVITRRYIRRIQPMSVNALRLWLSLLLWLVLERRSPDLGRAPMFYVHCLICAFTGPFLSRAALMYALKYMPANRVTLVSLVTPAITLLPSYLVFGTLPESHEWLGSLTLILGVAVPLLPSRTRAPSAREA